MEEKRKKGEPLQKFTEEEMRIAQETDLPDLLAHLGYQVKRVGNYHATAEMDSLRIKDRRTWIRYSSKQYGDAITFLQEFLGMKFPEAVNYLITRYGTGTGTGMDQRAFVSGRGGTACNRGETER